MYGYLLPLRLNSAIDVSCIINFLKDLKGEGEKDTDAKASIY
jgi:hypothetical protein